VRDADRAFIESAARTRALIVALLKSFAV